MSNNLFKVPFGFYVESTGFISKRSQIEDLLDGINADAEANAKMDAEQTAKIEANTESINKEVERSSSLDSKFETELEQEISERKRMGGILNSKISDLETNLKALVEETDKGFDAVADELRKKDEALDAKDVELTNSISEEAATRESADKVLSEAIKLTSSEIEEVNALIDNMSSNLGTVTDDVNSLKNNLQVLTEDLNVEVASRKEGDTILTEKVNTLVSSVKEVYDYAKTKDVELSDAINGKVDWTDLGNGRKSIVLNNHDLILGTDTAGSTSNIAMISKWNVVDLGSSKLPINLNTPSGVRPTVQEAGQSGEQAHKVAYLSDVETVEGKIPTVPTKVSELENDANYLIEHQDLSEYAKLSDIPSLDNYATKDEINELRNLIISLQNRVKELEGRVYNANELINLITKMREGEVLDIKLYNGIILTEANKMTIPVGATLNLDMNGNTISTEFADILFRVNGTLNISGEGKVTGNAYVASANSGAIVNVSNGIFESNITAFQANGGVVNINDGYFTASNETYGSKYLLNHVDARKNDGLINVNGGTFVNYNPEESYSENPPMNFVAEGYTVSKTIEGENTIYTVVKGSKVSSADDINGLVSSLQEGESVDLYLTNDVELDGSLPMFVNPNTIVNLNLNGNTFVNKVEGRAAIINDGTMTISNGKIINGNNAAQGGCAVLNRSVMVIENGEFGSKEQRGAAIENKGQLTINGGTFTSLEKGSDNLNGWAYVFINRGDENAIMTINNATSDCNAHGMFSAETGVINVNGGNYRLGAKGLATYYMAHVTDGIINLNGGTFNWTSGASNFPTYVGGNGSVNIGEDAKINW